MTAHKTDEAADFERNWKRRFERFAESHDDDAGIAGWSDSGLATRLRLFLKAWRDTPEARAVKSRWLDAGCGAGTYTRVLAADGRSVVAVDYSMPTVVKARQRVEGSAGAGWLTADVTKLPFASGSFDGAVCFGVMQALSSPNAALREFRRILQPGGTLWVDALNARCLPSALAEARRVKEGKAAHLRYDEPAAFKAALAQSGFDSLQLHWAPIVPGRWRALQRLVETSMFSATLNAVPPLAARLSHSILLRARACP
jgi:SAM-dependent methyltransferase